MLGSLHGSHLLISCGNVLYRWSSSRIPLGRPKRENNEDEAVLCEQDCYLHGRNQTVHVVASVAVVTEQQLVVILASPAQGAGLALDALPGVLLDTDQHVLRELEAGGVARPPALGATNQFLRLERFLVEARVAQAEVAVS